MNKQQTISKQNQQLLRHAILLQLEVAYPASLPMETLEQGLHVAGHNIGDHLLKKEIQYLIEKSFLTQLPQELSPSNHRYALTATGRDYLESQGLA